MTKEIGLADNELHMGVCDGCFLITPCTTVSTYGVAYV